MANILTKNIIQVMEDSKDFCSFLPITNTCNGPLTNKNLFQAIKKNIKLQIYEELFMEKLHKQ